MRYSFTITSHGRRIRHQERELPDNKEARVEALRFVAGALGDPALNNWDGDDLTVEVNSTEGEPRMAVHILCVVSDQSMLADDEQFHEGEGHPS